MRRERLRAMSVAIAFIVAGVTASAGALALDPRPVAAHADLVRSAPAAGAELSDAPTEIELWFSEPIEPEFSTVVLLDTAGSRIEPTAVLVFKGSQRVVAELPALEAGVYTVVARTLSQVDGHVAPASFQFTVLGADGGTPDSPTFDAGSVDAGGGLSALATLGRWVTVIGLVGLFGGGALSVAASRGTGSGDPSFVSAVQRRFEQVAVVAIVLVVVGDVATLAALLDALGGSVLALVRDTRAGTLLVVRELALVAGLVAATALSTRADVRALLGLVVGAAGLYTVAAVSHATAAPGTGWAFAAQYAHVLLAAFWLGGLGLLAYVARRERIATEPGLALIAWFSSAAIVSVGLLAVTGVVRSAGELPSLGALFDTHYGRLLLLKLGLLTPLLGVAWFNRRTIEAQAPGSEEATARQLRQLLPVEAALALVVLLAAAALGQASTPRAAAGPTDGAGIFASPAPQLPDALVLVIAVAGLAALAWVALRARPLPTLSRGATGVTAGVAVVGVAVGIVAAVAGGASTGLACPEAGPGANLAGCDLRGRTFDRVNLREANLTGADLRGASLRFASLTGATLLGSDLREADLTGAALHEAVLNGADLRGANLQGTNAVGALLHDADLGGANLFGADLARASLIGASFNGAIVHETHLTEADLTGVDWRNTACPEGPEAIPGGVALCYEGRLPGE